MKRILSSLLLLLGFLLPVALPQSVEAIGAASAAQAGSATQPTTWGNLWFNAAKLNGGAPSTTRRDLNIGLINSWQVDSTWFLLDDIHMLVAEDAGSALTSWKTRTLATVTAAPAFTIDRGYACNGTTQFIDTVRFQSTTAWQTTTNSSLRFAIYERTNQISVGTAAGGSSGSALMRLSPRNTSTVLIGAANNSTANYTITAESRGYWSINHPAGGTTTTAYENGATLGGQTVTSGGQLGARSLYICARNNAGTGDQFRAATEGLFEWGGQVFTAGQESSHYTSLQAYMTTLGANVP